MTESRFRISPGFLATYLPDPETGRRPRAARSLRVHAPTWAAGEARRLRPGIRVALITGVDLRPGPHADVQRVFTKPIDDEALAAYLKASDG